MPGLEAQNEILCCSPPEAFSAVGRMSNISGFAFLDRDSSHDSAFADAVCEGAVMDDVTVRIECNLNNEL